MQLCNECKYYKYHGDQCNSPQFNTRSLITGVYRTQSCTVIRAWEWAITGSPKCKSFEPTLFFKIVGLISPLHDE